jgi:hypothetical protein
MTLTLRTLHRHENHKSINFSFHYRHSGRFPSRSFFCLRGIPFVPPKGRTKGRYASGSTFVRSSPIIGEDGRRSGPFRSAIPFKFAVSLPASILSIRKTRVPCIILGYITQTDAARFFDILPILYEMMLIANTLRPQIGKTWPK